MIRASLYILGCSLKNRLRMRVRRLREPRYLLGAVAGAAYLYFSVFMRIFGTRRARQRGRGVPQFPAVVPPFVPMVAGAGLLVLAGLAWIMPGTSTLLEFSEAEIQLLFPAPVSRR